jgi:sugar lactone lactonase YvrE
MRAALPQVEGPFVIYSEEFRAVLGDAPRLEELVATDAHEGPVYVAALDALFFTTVPRAVDVPLQGFKEVSIGRLEVAARTLSTLRAASNLANGMTLDREGRLLVCEQGTKTRRARISRIDLDTNAETTVVDEWFGLTFNSPNDLVVKSDGTVWFTDPSYGYLQGSRTRRWWAISSTGTIRRRARRRWSPIRSTSRTGSLSRRTSRSSTSTIPPPSRAPAPTS